METNLESYRILTSEGQTMGNPLVPPQDSSPTDSALWDDPWTPDMGIDDMKASDSSHVYIMYIYIFIIIYLYINL